MSKEIQHPQWENIQGELMGVRQQGGEEGMALQKQVFCADNAGWWRETEPPALGPCQCLSSANISPSHRALLLGRGRYYWWR